MDYNSSRNDAYPTRIRKEALDLVLDKWANTKLSETEIADAVNQIFGTSYSHRTVNNVVVGSRKRGDARAVYRRQKQSA